MSDTGKRGWEDLLMEVFFVGFASVVCFVVLAIAIWAISAAVSYAGCEISPTSERCVAIDIRDGGKLPDAVVEHLR